MLVPAEEAWERAYEQALTTSAWQHAKWLPEAIGPRFTAASRCGAASAAGRDDLVRRRPAADDGRSYLTCLTDAGLAKLDQARPTHNAVIREVFLERIPHRDQAALVRTWRTIDHVRSG